jgi:3-hydroxyisobutyrate dehydrogenase-like beta-hydroxyacid dehydrogenase
MTRIGFVGLGSMGAPLAGEPAGSTAGPGPKAA